MQQRDPGRVSTIVISPLDLPREKQLRRKILPPTKGRSNELFVEDCVSHTPGVDATVPVALQRLQPEGAGWTEVGTARCCPLCWSIVVPPTGVDIPKALPLAEAPKIRTTRLTKKASDLVGLPQVRDARATWASVYEGSQKCTAPFTVYDAMEWTGKGRTVTLKVINHMVRSNYLVRVHLGRRGPGNPSLYEKVLKKDIETPQKQKDKGVDEENANDVRFW